jgi:hypothetical protein
MSRIDPCISAVNVQKYKDNRNPAAPQRGRFGCGARGGPAYLLLVRRLERRTY